VLVAEASFITNNRALAFDKEVSALTADSFRPAKRPLPSSKRELPRLYETGGLVVFLHIAKTGGSTIRDNFDKSSRFPNVKVARVLHEAKMEDDAIVHFVSSENTRNETLLLEFHGGRGQPLTMFQLHPYIHQWRSMAKANDKSLFVFTMLREPSSFYVSYFNFFKGPGCTWSWCDPRKRTWSSS